MSGDFLRLTANLARMAFSSRSSRKAIAAAFKVCGHRLETRWPLLPKATGKDLNLSFDDLLAFQWARAGEFSALVVGAYDGVANDPASEFIRVHGARAVFVEPQPGPFGRLRGSMAGYPRVDLVNAAIDRKSGSREFFTVPSGIVGLPAWSEQLGSFDRAHLLKHEDRAPGLASHRDANGADAVVRRRFGSIRVHRARPVADRRRGDGRPTAGMVSVRAVKASAPLL